MQFQPRCCEFEQTYLQIPRGLLGRGGGGGERNLMLKIDRCINNTLATTEYLSILLISTEDIENS